MKKRITFIFILIILLTGILLFYSQKKPQAPKLTFTSVQNQVIYPQDLTNKVILINFWATSCPGCIKEMPQLIKIHQQFANQGFEIIAVAMQYDPPNFVLNYVKKNNFPFLIALDTQGTIAKAYDNVNLTPTFFLLNKKGEIVQKIVGIPDFDHLNKLIANYIKS
jgi:thiol-disulfide isomerase/thioredoxin